jgi:hypothetical protein
MYSIHDSPPKNDTDEDVDGGKRRVKQDILKFNIGKAWILMTDTILVRNTRKHRAKEAALLR